MTSHPHAKRPLRVAIDARLSPNSGIGGVESVLIALIRALGALSDGEEELVVIGPAENAGWWKEFTGPNQRIVAGPSLVSPPRVAAGPAQRVVRSAVRRMRRVRDRLTGLAAQAQPDPSRWPAVPISDGFYEALGCQVLHVPYQPYTLTALPTIYNPHDIQHRHFPQFFTAHEIAWREVMFDRGCNLAHTVVVASRFVKEDIIRHYHIASDKIQIVPFAPPMQVIARANAEKLDEVRAKYSLRGPFALYPAMTWEHKNHLRLLDAVAWLREKKRATLTLVCTGKKTRFWPVIEARIQALGLGDQVLFPGLIPAEDLRALYQLARLVVIPTLFEATSEPIYEAWEAGAPVACSNVTALPEQAGDAATLFDPTSPEAIAQSIHDLATSDALRDDLVRRGTARLERFSWDRTARAYRALYRRAAGFPLSDEDRRLIGWDWMTEPADVPELRRRERRG